LWTHDDYIRLWGSVIAQAVADLDDASDKIREEAEEWLLSEESDVGSLEWICNSMDASANTVRDRALEGDEWRRQF
jgi:hypothetical protein